MARKELLVLGNGFDLQCGLKSRYSDFEDPRIRKLSAPFPQKAKQEDWIWFNNENLTVWDLILNEDYDRNAWYDIEDCIARWTSRQLDSISMRYKSTFLDDSEKRLYEEQPFWKWNDIESSIGYYARARYNWDGSSQELLSILFAQLNVFEAQFTKYMKKQVDASESYYKRAQELIEVLANDRERAVNWLRYSRSARSYGSNAYGLTILNFNFTEPLMRLQDEFPFRVNIHGSLTGRNVIFGIDGTDFDMSDPRDSGRVRFTKTYRLMQLRTREYEPIVSTETDTIKFYGHSLGSADYAYFQSIFDTIDLYGGKTHLIFYYQNESFAPDMYGKVNRLINTYGKTLDNLNHGKNLLHKLLLEGRLSVIQAPLHELSWQEAPPSGLQ